MTCMDLTRYNWSGMGEGGGSGAVVGGLGTKRLNARGGRAEERNPNTATAVMAASRITLNSSLSF